MAKFIITGCHFCQHEKGVCKRKLQKLSHDITWCGMFMDVTFANIKHVFQQQEFGSDLCKHVPYFVKETFRNIISTYGHQDFYKFICVTLHEEVCLSLKS